MSKSDKIRVLVFPCGSEVGLEIHRSLKYSRHIELFGGNSTKDHGKFVFDNYIDDILYITDANFLQHLKKVIINNKIDVIYPAMDAVMTVLKPLEDELKCKVIASPNKTNEICLSKKETYLYLKNVVLTPIVYKDINDVNKFPVFIKPIKGYGSRGAKRINSLSEGKSHLKEWENCIITEYLSGTEYTVDCFTNKEGNLLFAGPRPRRRIRTGISVNTVSIRKSKRTEFEEIARSINKNLHFRGAWFFQVKRNTSGQLVLMEVASRLGGSSSLYRYKGINFALLSIFDAFNFDVEIIENNIMVEIDRALNIQVKFDYDYNKVYVDFDDCLIIENRVNTILLSKLYQFINEGKEIYLITKHSKDIKTSLQKFRLNNLFDKVIHIDQNEKKSKYIIGEKAIFIDDSYSERKDVALVHNIPVFSPDMINL